MPDPASHADIQAEIDRLQSQLDVLRDQLAQSQRLSTIGVLAAGVLHEINNTLTPALSYAHLASSRRSDSELQDKAFSKIIGGIGSACGIAESMLSFARDRDEKLSAELGQVVEQTLAAMGRDPARDGIEIAVAIHTTASVAIRPLALQQVLMNLVLNACAAMDGTPGRIAIEARPGDSDQTTVTVIDNGPGIPAAIRDRLFEPFVSGHSYECAETRRFGGGSGLGLMVSRQLIESAGGTIEVDSTPGEGTTFRIVLPNELPPRAMAG